MDYKLEVVVVPVADVDRAKDLYKALGWRELQEITTRLLGPVTRSGTAVPHRRRTQMPTTYDSAADLAEALRRAEAAHGEHEQRTGQRDENWPDWYAEYMVAEQAGTELPT